VNFTHLKVKCGARYWEDATVNGVEDTEGLLIPLRDEYLKLTNIQQKSQLN